MLINRRFTFLDVSRRSAHTSHYCDNGSDSKEHCETPQTTLRHLRQHRQRPRPVRGRARRSWPQPARQTGNPRRLLQVLGPEDTPRRQRRQRRPRRLPRRHPRPRAADGARQRADRLRGPRPARPDRPRPDLRAGRGNRHRDPRRELEGRRQVRRPVARQPARLRRAEDRQQTRGPHDHRRRHGGSCFRYGPRSGKPPAASGSGSAPS